MTTARLAALASRLDALLTWRLLSTLVFWLGVILAFDHDYGAASFLVAFACFARLRAIDDGEPR